MNSFFSSQSSESHSGKSFGHGVSFAFGGNDAEPLLVGEDRVAEFVPAVVEQMHVADLLDPLRRRMMRRVRAAGNVIDEERFVGRDLLELLHIRDGVIGHGRGQIPTGLPLKRIDGRRVAEQVRLPLAGVAADEPVEIIETHADRPLIERPGLARLIKGRVVILAEPRGRVTVLLENLADRAAILLDDRVVPRESRRRFAHDAIAGHVMVAAGDQCRARRRAERRGMKLRVPQSRSSRCDPTPASGRRRRTCSARQSRNRRS